MIPAILFAIGIGLVATNLPDNSAKHVDDVPSGFMSGEPAKDRKPSGYPTMEELDAIENGK